VLAPWVRLEPWISQGSSLPPSPRCPGSTNASWWGLTVQTAPARRLRAILVIDGVFLLRPELRELWTFSVYLRVSPEETLRRAHRRDLGLFGSAEEVERRYLGRYLPGQALYRQEADPEARAHILVDNEQTDEPRIERWTVPGVASPAWSRPPLTPLT